MTCTYLLTTTNGLLNTVNSPWPSFIRLAVCVNNLGFLCCIHIVKVVPYLLSHTKCLHNDTLNLKCKVHVVVTVIYFMATVLSNHASFHIQVLHCVKQKINKLCTDMEIQEYRNIRCLLYESTQRTDHSHQRYSNTVSLYSTSIFTHSHTCTINDP